MATRLTHEERERLAAYAATARWPAGFSLYQRGAPADGLFVVVSGTVVLRTRLKGGRAFVPGIITVGEVFGLEGLAPGAVYETDARVEEETQTLHLSRDRLRTLLRERPLDVVALTAQVGDAQATVLARVRELAMMSVEQRLLAAVTRTRQTRQSMLPDQPVRFDAAGYRLLCEMVGATRESVSLVVNRMVADGSARRDGNSVTIGPAPRRTGDFRRLELDLERTLAVMVEPPVAR